MGLRHLRVFAAMDDRFDVAGAYDVRADVVVPDGIARLRSEEEAVASAELVIVATPTGAHGGAVSRALAAGRHVLVEKPLCSTAAEATALAALATRSGARLFVGQSERFNPVVRVLAKLLRDEAPLQMDLARVGPCRPTECGALFNLGVHDFDLAAYLGRSPLTLVGALGDGDDFAHVLFTTASGVVGHLYVDRTAPAKRRRIALVTPRWLYEGDLLSHALFRIERSSRATGQRADVPLPLAEPLAAQAASLADALDGIGGRDIATGEDGAYAVALAEEASRNTCRRPRLAGTP